MREISVVPDGKLSPEPGPAPMLDWIEIGKLCVDDRYQRELSEKNWRAIRTIARNFRWSRFSPVFCAPIEGGRFAIIDGQHRTHAAAMCGMKSVPCQIVQMDLAEQAEAFSAVNGAVTAITIWNLFRAQLAAGDEKATALAEAAKAAGCQIALANASAKTKKPGTIYFISGAQKLFDQHGDTFTKALRAIRGAGGFNDNADLWSGWTMQPLLEALCANASLLDHPDLTDAIESFDVYDVIDKAEEERRRRMRQGLSVLSNKDMLRNKFQQHLVAELAEEKAA